MYGARHAMLHARAMPCGGEGIPERGCRKTPDFGHVEGRRCPFQTYRNIQLQRARARMARVCGGWIYSGTLAGAVRDTGSIQYGTMMAAW